jgi:alpha-tubulin suppressor-like RCC1 family protein
VAAGQGDTCVLLSDETVRCFGDNANGQLGIGTRDPVGLTAASMGDALKAVSLGTGFRVKKIVAGARSNCALSVDGVIKCWGENSWGQLGLGAAGDVGGTAVDPAVGYQPVNLGVGQLVSDLSCGAQHCCAVTVQHTLKCWGANSAGQLGLGDTLPRGLAAEDMGDSLPFVEIQDLEQVKSVHLQASRSCAVTTRGMLCWGENRNGQLGTGDSDPRGTTLDTVPSMLTPLLAP